MRDLGGMVAEATRPRPSHRDEAFGLISTRDPVAMSTRRFFHAGLCALALVSFVVAFKVGSTARSRRATTMRRAVERGVTVGRSLLLVYVGDSRCAWCRDPRMPVLLQRIQAHVSAVAESSSVGFRMAGIAVDPIPEQGLRHLRQVGPMFLEVASGGGWQSLGIAGIGADSAGGRESTPQLILLERWVSDARSDTALQVAVVSRQRVIRRLIGVAEIEAWVDEGMPTPHEVPPASTGGSRTESP